jgi:hypothetical protein
MGFVTFLHSRRSLSPVSSGVEEKAGKQGTDHRQPSFPAPGKSPAPAEVKLQPDAPQTTPPVKQLAEKQTPPSQPGSTPEVATTEESDGTRGRQLSLAATTLPEVKRVYVDALGADTLGPQIRELLITKLSSRGRFILVEKRADADAVFKGVVKRVNHTTDEVSVSIRLVNARGEVIWSNGSAYSGKGPEITNRLINDLLADIKKLEDKR